MPTAVRARRPARFPRGRIRTLLAATLAAVLPACADLDSTADPDSILLLTATPRSVAADGFSVTTIVAELDPRTAEQYRDVSFTTTLGRFVGGTSSQDTSIVVAADAQARATVELRSGTLTGTAVVTAEIREGAVVKVARSIEVPFEPAPASDVLSLVLSGTEAPADGASVTNVVARIATEIIQGERTVTFSTTAGTLGGATAQSLSVRAGTDDTAAVGLVSPREVGTAVVTATVNDVTARAAVTFVAAPPDSASLSSSSFRLAAAFSTRAFLTMRLFRETGTVTRGTEVVFEATDESSQQTFGFWSAVTPTDSTGVATAEFTPGNTNQRGEATFRARVPGAGVSSTVRFEVVDP